MNSLFISDSFKNSYFENQVDVDKIFMRKTEDGRQLPSYLEMF